MSLLLLLKTVINATVISPASAATASSVAQIVNASIVAPAAAANASISAPIYIESEALLVVSMTATASSSAQVISILVGTPAGTATANAPPPTINIKIASPPAAADYVTVKANGLLVGYDPPSGIDNTVGINFDPTAQVWESFTPYAVVGDPGWWNATSPEILRWYATVKPTNPVDSALRFSATTQAAHYTGTSEPTGAGSDGGIVWDLYGTSYSSTWQSLHLYTIGTLIVRNGDLFVALPNNFVSGTSGASEPNWTAVDYGNLIPDSATLKWVRQGPITAWTANTFKQAQANATRGSLVFPYVTLSNGKILGEPAFYSSYSAGFGLSDTTEPTWRATTVGHGDFYVDLSIAWHEGSYATGGYVKGERLVISGFAVPSADMLLVVRNTGTGTMKVVLADKTESAGIVPPSLFSGFNFGGTSLVLSAGESVKLFYDTATDEWTIATAAAASEVRVIPSVASATASSSTPVVSENLASPSAIATASSSAPVVLVPADVTVVSDPAVATASADAPIYVESATLPTSPGIATASIPLVTVSLVVVSPAAESTASSSSPTVIAEITVTSVPAVATASASSPVLNELLSTPAAIATASVSAVPVVTILASPCASTAAASSPSIALVVVSPAASAAASIEPPIYIESETFPVVPGVATASIFAPTILVTVAPALSAATASSSAQTLEVRVVSPASTATASSVAPTVILSPVVVSLPSVATASGVAPVVVEVIPSSAGMATASISTPLVNVTVVAPACVATASAPAPIYIESAAILPPAGAATATFPVPSLFVGALVAVPVASATASAIAPVVIETLVTPAQPATAASGAPIPDISVQVVTSAAMATATSPSSETDASPSVVPAVATASFPAPTLYVTLVAGISATASFPTPTPTVIVFAVPAQATASAEAPIYIESEDLPVTPANATAEGIPAVPTIVLGVVPGEATASAVEPNLYFPTDLVMESPAMAATAEMPAPSVELDVIIQSVAAEATAGPGTTVESITIVAPAANTAGQTIVITNVFGCAPSLKATARFVIPLLAGEEPVEPGPVPGYADGGVSVYQGGPLVPAGSPFRKVLVPPAEAFAQVPAPGLNRESILYVEKVIEVPVQIQTASTGLAEPQVSEGALPAEEKVDLGEPKPDRIVVEKIVEVEIPVVDRKEARRIAEDLAFYNGIH